MRSLESFRTQGLSADGDAELLRAEGVGDPAAAPHAVERPPQLKDGILGLVNHWQDLFNPKFT